MATKPRVFIGSSVEGRDIAFAVQQNLVHDVEATVWSQGVFELSATSIEALIKVLDTSDFGIFVFSPDDEVKMRGATSPSIRDNVLFEMGLFIGRLGRERVFFLAPEGKDLHIPSDLMGVTGARYQTNRADRNFEAATGAACNQMRTQMSKLPLLVAEPTSSSAEPVIESPAATRYWIDDLVEKKYADAKRGLQDELKTLTGDAAIEHEAWIALCDLKLDEKAGLQHLLNMAKARPDSLATQENAAVMLRLGGYTDKAIELLTSLPSPMKETPAIKLALSRCFVDAGDARSALDVFSVADAQSDASIAFHVVSLLEGKKLHGDAMTILHGCYKAHPNDTDIRYKLAHLAKEAGEHHIALHLLDKLTRQFPENAEYWGYLGNSCLDLDLNDRATHAYRKAERIYAGAETGDWIQGNIGNMFNNAQLPSEAVPYFERVLLRSVKSEYSNERLADALKSVAEKEKQFKEFSDEGQQKLRNRNAMDSAVSLGSLVAPL